MVNKAVVGPSNTVFVVLTSLSTEASSRPALRPQLHQCCDTLYHWSLRRLSLRQRCVLYSLTKCMVNKLRTLWYNLLKTWLNIALAFYTFLYKADSPERSVTRRTYSVCIGYRKLHQYHIHSDEKRNVPNWICIIRILSKIRSWCPEFWFGVKKYTTNTTLTNANTIRQNEGIATFSF